MAEFYCPTKIYTGEHALEILCTLQAKRVLVITDSFFSEKGKQIGTMVPGAQVQVFDQVKPDPTAELAAQGAAVCRSFQPELLIALGGGSPMDCAKAIRMAQEEPIQFVAIPTTSGSGSEMTSFSILTHNGVKHPLVDASLRPDVAILDGTLLEQLPPALIADTGMDLLAHCLEALVGKNRTGFSDAMAFYGAAAVFENLERSFHGNRDVRLHLHEAATMAGMAFDNAGLGVCHALAHTLGGAFHLPHGRLCSMLLPAVLTYHENVGMEQYAALAKQCGMPCPTKRLGVKSLIAAVVRLQKELNLPANLKQAGITKQQYEEKQEQIITAALEDPCCETDPLPATREGLMSILKAVRP